ncbi:MAG: 1,4-dihydroxy-2-naphthoate polyprenyltransferase [candidate division Zixibacteria bacterium]|nr:1,4-dihydroxy-2-naphthoate polyprenyltransferase [candidate division Zixibacteria bacterium]
MLAARPKTLPAGVVPVLVGGVLAYSHGGFSILPFLAALFGSVMIQIGTNFANDFFDFKKNTDTAERVGPMRVTQAGLVTQRQITMAMIIAFGLAFLAGIYLVSIGGWPIVIIGLASILCGVLYTAGPYALGYLGLGEIFVLVFYGPVALAGTYYVQTLNAPTEIIVAGLPFGMISTAILIVNNLRDVDTDKKTGKNTLAVRFGKTFARIEYAVMIAGAGVIAPILMSMGHGGKFMYVSIAYLIFAPPAVRAVFTSNDGEQLNATLAATGKLLIIYGILFSLGWVL